MAATTTVTITADRTTVMATSSGRLRGRVKLCAGLLGALGVLATAACSSPAQDKVSATAQSQPPPFAWFQAGPAPAGWRSIELPDERAVLSVPPDAKQTESDPGSVSAAVTAPDGKLQVYFNATPQQGDESLANWSSFRLDHLADENASSAFPIAERTGMGFRGGRGSCVADSYVTRVGGNRYREIACLVTGTRASSVLVVAAPAESWELYSPVLEQAVNSYRAE